MNATLKTMDRDSEKEKSSRKRRDSDRDHHKHHHHNSKHRSGDADDDRRQRSKHREDGEDRRYTREFSAEREREKSVDLRGEEEGGRRRIKRERSYEREGSSERKYSRDESDGGAKRARVLEDKKGFPTDAGSIAATNGNGVEPVSSASRNETNYQDHSPDIKVSSISTTNENKGVNSNRSHEVPGKSSTDVSTSGAGKMGGLSRDHLDKVKKTLLRQKELEAKMKKIPLLNKTAGANRGSTPQLGSKVGISTPPVVSTSRLATEGLNPPPSGLPHVTGLNQETFEFVRKAQEVAAKMGFRQDPEFAPLINMFPGQMPSEVTIQPKPAKAPVLRLDNLGREIDEHGNVVNVPKVNALSTLKVNINKQKKDSFQILKPELEVDPEKNPHFDPGMGINKAKLLRPKKMNFQFVEEGKWSKDAETIKLKNQFGEARAKELRAKQAQLARAKAEPDINPNLIEVSERVITKEKPKEAIPDVEWWDVPLLHSGGYGEIVDGKLNEDNLKTEKITIYVEHPRPIEPPAEPAPPPPQPLKLTKKEQKKLRTQRRLAREKDKQDMIRQGILEPPKSKVKMSNLMRVLGSEATQDPTKMEREIRTAAAEREQAHHDRNIARKLTPAERREKKERKLFDEQSTSETIVSVYKINNLSHPQARFKVDANAHENRLTGCAVITQGVSVVVVEGCQKSIKRYGKLMLRRIDWPTMVQKEGEDEDEDTGDDGPPNKCSLVWQGCVAKPSFHRFFVHECLSDAAARKVFNDHQVSHYWDQALNYAEE